MKRKNNKQYKIVDKYKQWQYNEIVVEIATQNN